MTRHYYPLDFLHLDEGISNPWWNPLGDISCIWAAYQPKGAASFAASLLDLSGLGNNAADPGGLNTPAWDAVNGWKFDGVAVPNGDYLTTTFVPQNDQTQTGIIQFTTRTGTPGTWFGSRGAGPNDYFSHGWSGTTRYPANGQFAAVGGAPAAGNVAVAGNRGYLNGIDDGVALGAWGAAGIFSVWIGARNLSGVAEVPGAFYCQAFALYDCTLTAPQVAAIAAAMAAL